MNNYFNNINSKNNGKQLDNYLLPELNLSLMAKNYSGKTYG